jgi:nucleotide-binding universal stress UspA family protein
VGVASRLQIRLAMSPFKKILVPLDFSAHSDEALRVACAMAETFGASLTLVNVFSPPIYPTPEGAYVVLPTIYADLIAANNKRLEETVASVKRDHATLEVDCRALEGVPFREIVGFARKGAFDLVVMGTHGRTGLKHALLGSVAEKVVRKAPCAVLTVRLAGHSFEHP